MKTHGFTAIIAVELGLILAAAPALSQTRPPTEGPAVDGSPAWFLQGSFPDPGGRLLLTLDESGRRGHERRPHHPDGCAWTVTGFEDDRDAGGGVEQETRRR